MNKTIILTALATAALAATGFTGGLSAAYAASFAAGAMLQPETSGFTAKSPRI